MMADHDAPLGISLNDQGGMNVERRLIRHDGQGDR
jgi:hypothetical protein